MKNMVSEAAPATPEQQQHATGMITSAVALPVEKYLDTHGGAIRFVDHGMEVTNDVRDFVRELVRKYGTPNQFANEEVSSTYTYPREYKGPKPIVEQINTLASIFGLDPASALAYAQNLPAFESFVPEDALPLVGWFAFPRAVELGVVLAKLGESRRFYNYRESQMDRFRIHMRTQYFLAQIADAQRNGDILVAALQLGMRHRGRSNNRARELFVANEYGATSVMGGSVALTHPERFVRWDELDMDLPGDEFDDPDSGARFDHAPYLRFDDGGLEFDTDRVDYAFDCFGSVSGFVPQ